MKTISSIGTFTLLSLATAYAVGSTFGPFGLILSVPTCMLIIKGTLAVADEVFI